MEDLTPDALSEIPSRYNTTTVGNWLRLFRAPNLLTVSGDPIMGFMVMAPAAPWSRPHIWVAIAAALLFYTGGTIFNDIVDIRRDLNRRPWRPLPFGLISVVNAEVAATVCMAVGIGLSMLNGFDSLMIGVSLVVAISAYNLELKHIAWLGPPALGFCRGLSVLLGVFAVPGNPPLSSSAAFVAAAGAAYVLGLSLYARHERCPRLPFWAGAAPVLGAGTAVFLCAPLGASVPLGRLLPALVLLAGFVGGACWVVARSLFADDAVSLDFDRPAAVGLLLRGLLLLQAAIVLMTGHSALHLAVVFLLLAAWPLHAYWGKVFYSS